MDPLPTLAAKPARSVTTVMLPITAAAGGRKATVGRLRDNYWRNRPRDGVTDAIVTSDSLGLRDWFVGVDVRVSSTAVTLFPGVTARGGRGSATAATGATT